MIINTLNQTKGNVMFTVEIYKRDSRTKTGERMVLKKDYDAIMLREVLENSFKGAPAEYRHEIHETYVTRINLMTGMNFQERYDHPYSTSPSSEAYWSS